MYYKILKRIVDAFNLQLKLLISRHARISEPKVEIYTKYRKFTPILNPIKWIWVKGDILSNEIYSGYFLDLVTEANFPFLAIVNPDGFWFADISQKYYAVAENFILNYDPTKVKIADGTLMYNYPIFWFGTARYNDYFDVKSNELRKLPNSIDYFISLKEFSGWSKITVSFLIRIQPREFVFDGAFLTHRNYDSGDRLNVSFLKEIAKIIGKLVKINKTRIKMKFGEDIESKTELLDEIEKNFILPKCQEYNYAYKPMLGNINVDLRLRNIRQILADLKQKI